MRCWIGGNMGNHSRRAREIKDFFFPLGWCGFFTFSILYISSFLSFENKFSSPSFQTIPFLGGFFFKIPLIRTWSYMGRDSKGEIRFTLIYQASCIVDYFYYLSTMLDVDTYHKRRDRSSTMTLVWIQFFLENILNNKS